MSTQIIVIKLGWVLVGNVSEQDNTLRVSNTSNIRVWGTKKGLGEIALGGPTSETKLDKIGTAVVERDAVLFRIDCEEKPWKKHL